MRCEICGSKKDVRIFQSVMGHVSYKECRKCFELGVRLGCAMQDLKLDKEALEAEWNRGKDK